MDNGLIRTICHTNLDDYKSCEWPKCMYHPRIGDRVKAIDSDKSLRIVRIMHGYDRKENYYYLEMELHN